VFCGLVPFNQPEGVTGRIARSSPRRNVQPPILPPVDSRPLRLTAHQVVLSKTKKFNLYLPPGFEITVAVQGLKRSRFMARSPDGRVFVTDMFNRTDIRKGAVYALDGFDTNSGKFNKVTPYLKNLRNPNSIAFYTDRQR